MAPTFSMAYFSKTPKNLGDMMSILNVLMSIQLPFAVIPMLTFTSSRYVNMPIWYRVYQSELVKTTWPWGIEGSIFFFKLEGLVASGGLDSWVSSTCFQKSNIGWPQQPPTEKVLKFNMTFHDSTKKIFFFQNTKINLNSWTWMTWKSSVVIFHLQPQWPQ